MKKVQRSLVHYAARTGPRNKRTFYPRAQTMERIEQLAQAKGLSVAATIERAVVAGLERIEGTSDNGSNQEK